MLYFSPQLRICPQQAQSKIPPFSQTSSVLQNVTVTTNFSLMEEVLTELSQFAVCYHVFTELWCLSMLECLTPPNREVKFGFAQLKLQLMHRHLSKDSRLCICASSSGPTFLAEIFLKLLNLGFIGLVSWKIQIN